MQSDVLVSPPRTIMEVFKMLPEGTRVELINETLYMSPATKTSHQRVIWKIENQITRHTESIGGEVFFAPCDVYLDEVANAVQPDIIYIAEDQKEITHEDGIHGTPRLIIEVLSPGNQKSDKETKKKLYEKFGVAEYWIVDPATRQTIGYFLKERKKVC